MDTASPALPAKKVVARPVSKRRLQIRILRKRRKGSDGHGPIRLSQGAAPLRLLERKGLTIFGFLRSCSLLRPLRRPARSRVACGTMTDHRRFRRPESWMCGDDRHPTWELGVFVQSTDERTQLDEDPARRSLSGSLARDRRRASKQLQTAANNWREPVQSDGRRRCRRCVLFCVV